MGSQYAPSGLAQQPHSSSHGHHRHHHRNAMLHQHRSSAAALSDPMMAGGITDQLASASGPLTGSGGALNQLGAGGHHSQQQQHSYLAPAAYYSSSSREPNAAYLQQDSSGGGHTSRYDAHYSPWGRSHGGHSSAGRHHPSAAATAYQQSYAAGAPPYDPMDPSAPPTRYYGAHQHHHQSLGNLSSARYAGDPLAEGRGYGLEPMASHQQQAYRHSSMGEPHQQSLGLGQYNPLDDPLLSSAGLLAGGAHSQVGFGLGHSLGGAQHHSLGGQAGWSAASNMPATNRDAYVTELRARLQELQASYVAAKRELETATQKLGSSMHSIKSFWSPELKKERALRKEEQTKYALINDQMKLMRVEVQVSCSPAQGGCASLQPS